MTGETTRATSGVSQSASGGPQAEDTARSGSIRQLWRADRKGLSIDLLRIGLGVIWAGNLLFVVAPTNQFFPTFHDVALSYAPATLGGPGVATFVAENAATFAWITALLTGYLAVAFLLGITTRLACVVGVLASIAFLITQWAITFSMPGGTDVGPHPLYLLIYFALFAGGAGRYAALDQSMWRRGRLRFPRLARWLTSPLD